MSEAKENARPLRSLRLGGRNGLVKGSWTIFSDVEPTEFVDGLDGNMQERITLTGCHEHSMP